MTAKGRYVAAVCPHCGEKQVIDARKLCEEIVVVLGQPSRLSVTCVKCGKTFTVTLDCSEYE